MLRQHIEAAAIYLTLVPALVWHIAMTDHSYAWIVCGEEVIECSCLDCPRVFFQRGK